ncbi:hypothetical protein ACET3X_000093 [Alternaria dauci]|uniref:Uncharacterized protein n=1 Tax=Alternaria dauci TaxID=48095 RepID=A0ABR3UTF7_9PLEO
MESTSYQADAISASPLLRLPFEIRLMIYEYLLLPSKTPSTGNGTSVANLIPDFHTYLSEDTNNDPCTLSVRTMDPWLGVQGPRTWRRRSTYHIRTGPFLTTTTPTTYRVLLSPYTSHLRQTVPSLLSLNRQIHAEASKILYSTYTFSFHTSIEAAVPFLSDLTPRSRTALRHLSVTKKALPYSKEFDRAEWANLFEYLATPPQSALDGTEIPAPVSLRRLTLNVIAGKPDHGWESITPILPSDFDTMLRMKNEWLGGSRGGGDFGGMDLEWAEQVMAIKGLESINVKAIVERCASPFVPPYSMSSRYDALRASEDRDGPAPLQTDENIRTTSRNSSISIQLYGAQDVSAASKPSVDSTQQNEDQSDRVASEGSINSRQQHKDEGVRTFTVPVHKAGMSLGQPATIVRRIGKLPCTLLVLSIFGTAAFIIYITFLWFTASGNKTWKYIALSGWMTRSIAIAAVVLRTSSTMQAGVASSMLAAIALESTAGVTLPDLVPLSLMRSSSAAPYALLAHTRLGRNRKDWLLIAFAVIISVTTVSLQFTSTILLADVNAGFIPR